MTRNRICVRLLFILGTLLFSNVYCISRPFSFLSTILIPQEIEPGESITSEDFEVEGRSWRLVVYPKGDKIAKRLGLCSVYLECLKGTDNAEACFEISLVGSGRSQNEAKTAVQKKKCSSHNFGTSFNPYGFMKFVEAKYLFETEHGCRDDEGRVSFFCEIGEPGAELGSFFGGEKSPPKSSTTTTTEERMPSGLVNQGNTCYLNSLLQSLYHVPAFAALFEEPAENGPVAGALSKVFEGLSRPGMATTTPLTQILGIDPRYQQDAQEFNRLLMNTLEDSDPVGEVAAGIQNLFSGYLSNYISCTEVDYEKKREELFYDISLDVKGCKNIQESLQRYTEPELLSGDNKWKTPDHGKQDALKGQKFLALPPVLQFHLKRFEYDFQTDRMSKVTQRFSFNTELDMKPYVADEIASDMSDGEATYALHSIVVHVGGAADAGHYYTYVRPSAKGKTWYKLDDQRVTKVKKKQVMEDTFGSTGKSLFGLRSRSGASAYLIQYVKKSDLNWLLQNDIAQ